MKLKKLELIGFKSFYDKTTFDFSAGVTAIVGPNGCGKSNIVDAIRWVLGEHAPSYLRSKALEDVIFAGSDAAGPTDRWAHASAVCQSWQWTMSACKPSRRMASAMPLTKNKNR